MRPNRNRILWSTVRPRSCGLGIAHPRNARMGWALVLAQDSAMARIARICQVAQTAQPTPNADKPHYVKLKMRDRPRATLPQWHPAVGRKAVGSSVFR